MAWHLQPNWPQPPSSRCRSKRSSKISFSKSDRCNRCLMATWCHRLPCPARHRGLCEGTVSSYSLPTSNPFVACAKQALCPHTWLKGISSRALQGSSGLCVYVIEQWVHLLKTFEERGPLLLVCFLVAVLISSALAALSDLLLITILALL